MPAELWNSVKVTASTAAQMRTWPKSGSVAGDFSEPRSSNSRLTLSRAVLSAGFWQLPLFWVPSTAVAQK